MQHLKKTAAMALTMLGKWFFVFHYGGIMMQLYDSTKHSTHKELNIPHYPLLYSWIGSRYTTPVIDDVEDVQTEIKYLDGTYYLIITRDVRTGDRQDLDLDKDLYMMFPVGGGNFYEASMIILRHTMTPSVSGVPVNLYESLTGTMRTATPPGTMHPGPKYTDIVVPV